MKPRISATTALLLALLFMNGTTGSAAPTRTGGDSADTTDPIARRLAELPILEASKKKSEEIRAERRALLQAVIRETRAHLGLPEDRSIPAPETPIVPALTYRDWIARLEKLGEGKLTDGKAIATIARQVHDSFRASTASPRPSGGDDELHADDPTLPPAEPAAPEKSSASNPEHDTPVALLRSLQSALAVLERPPGDDPRPAPSPAPTPGPRLADRDLEKNTPRGLGVPTETPKGSGQEKGLGPQGGNEGLARNGLTETPIPTNSASPAANGNQGDSSGSSASRGNSGAMTITPPEIPKPEPVSNAVFDSLLALGNTSSNNFPALSELAPGTSDPGEGGRGVAPSPPIFPAIPVKLEEAAKSQQKTSSAAPTAYAAKTTPKRPALRGPAAIAAALSGDGPANALASALLSGAPTAGPAAAPINKSAFDGDPFNLDPTKDEEPSRAVGSIAGAYGSSPLVEGTSDDNDESVPSINKALAPPSPGSTLSAASTTSPFFPALPGIRQQLVRRPTGRGLMAEIHKFHELCQTNLRASIGLCARRTQQQASR